MIRGTVTDTAAGTQNPEQTARFPNGVSAVSDASMSAWMEYVYMQKPKPADIIGVPVTLSVLDANGNYRQIGNTTSNSDGFFTFSWLPDIDGQYIVYASFDGSESYWPSHAVTSFAVYAAAHTNNNSITKMPQHRSSCTLTASTIAILIGIALGRTYTKKTTIKSQTKTIFPLF